MLIDVISQANCEGQANPQSQWLRVPKVAL